MDNKVGDKIRQLRNIKGLSQDNVAEEIGMSNGNFGKIERGEIDVSATHLIQIAKVLKVSVSEFFEDRQMVSEPRVAYERMPYEYASKEDLLTLTQTVLLLSQKIEKLSEAMPKKKTAAKKKHNKT